MVMQFKLPDLGENIQSGDIVNVMVSAGDTVQKDQPVLEIETDKAVIEVPSNISGKITELHIKPGQKALVGQTIFDYESGDGAASVSAPVPEEKPAPAEAPAVEEKAEAEPPAPAPKAAEPPKPAAPAPQPQAPAPPVVSSAPSLPVLPRSGAPTPAIPGAVAPAAPSVRRFAREIGIDINEVPGSGPGGRISIEDVKKYSKALNTKQPYKCPAHIVDVPLPDFGRWGEIERKPMTTVRRVTTEHMVRAWVTIPHVTQYDKADITRLEQLRKMHVRQAEATGGKLTVTAILVKIISSALKLFPQFNSTVDMKSQEIIYKKYYNIGIAVDTPRGLLVPVIKDVDKKNILELSAEMVEISEKARESKVTLEELNGGCFTITNLGGIGGTSFTPIVNTPEVAILGVSRAAMEPVYIDGEFQPRMMLPLSLSYDHRVIDGADGARFLRWIVGALEEPFVMSLEG